MGNVALAVDGAFETVKGYREDGNKIGMNTKKAAENALVGWAGARFGASTLGSIGAEIGTVAPPWGPAIGGFIGGAVGSIAGAMGAHWLVEMVNK